jgi:hypothetical protein
VAHSNGTFLDRFRVKKKSVNFAASLRVFDLLEETADLPEYRGRCTGRLQAHRQRSGVSSPGGGM